jgi:hypothetical protein
MTTTSPISAKVALSVQDIFDAVCFWLKEKKGLNANVTSYEIKYSKGGGAYEPSIVFDGIEVFLPLPDICQPATKEI